MSGAAHPLYLARLADCTWSLLAVPAMSGQHWPALPRPESILIAWAHWETELPMVATSKQPETIHDFGGFPDELYRIRYPAPGATSAAQRALQLLATLASARPPTAAAASITARGCRCCGCIPDAKVPVAQLSIQPSLGARPSSPRRRCACATGERGRAADRLRPPDAQPARMDHRRAAARFDDDRRTRARAIRARIHRLGRSRTADR